jgi:hypothetical protein
VYAWQPNIAGEAHDGHPTSSDEEYGQPAPRLEEGVAEAHRVLERLTEVGIDLEAVTRQLEEEGVHKFIVPFDKLMTMLEEKRAAALSGHGQAYLAFSHFGLRTTLPSKED